ncbi:mitochondrial tRNA N6-threonyl-carbamoyl-adenosine (t6A) Pgp1 [Schizosaccharomyces osmophilus]|uniref:N(6)-L-threonylcarbamoyladenine synthase n=1 Tax=Schizosaccharomyces osmophilus TaxID=2545709 RepID=A0AAE9WD19_9SCHI|nr:mitochondrial tRNA N6-threonyl-carbamoyl-adenosine (t6A) Pgp1 [Schizosaccharomyces osmophilus]WBW73660.1 mitochondrial tRNA N6-threonyl-carbamoyl-adenosine (t6A) Pgp1 [Schizosaccharomyces osmophilus]
MYRWYRLRNQLHCGFNYKKVIPPCRNITSLAIETSCDDTSVAVVQKSSSESLPKIVCLNTHRTLSKNEKYGGIHPSVVIQEHQKNLAKVVYETINQSRSLGVSKYDLIAVTRGPGMMGPLAIGLNFAKGLAVGLDKPLLAVHHMQAHALTVQLESRVSFPFLSILVSGGHTILILSKSVVAHEILASTTDIAIGDYLDKCAKYLEIPWNNQMPAAALEKFAVPTLNDKSIDCNPPNPMSSGDKAHNPNFSFSGLESYARRIITSKTWATSEKKLLAYKLQEAAFKHICQKMTKAIESLDLSKVRFLVCSGGVARNSLLKKMLKEQLISLHKRELAPEMKLVYPSLELCSDNAAMIAYTGIRMFEEGYKSSLEVEPIRKWPINTIMDVEGWMHQ